jgi:hypothetical protein
MRSARLATLFALLAVGVLPAALRAAEPATAAADPWTGWRFLAGDWTGVEDASKLTGAFSFRFELDDHVLVRRNHADLPAANGRPARKHEDLMVVYSGAGARKAIFFDNEGHILHYTAELSAGGKVLTFLTDADAAAPRFRLTYTKTADDALDIRFEIARPGTPESFSPYLSGHARRTGAPPPK